MVRKSYGKMRGTRQKMAGKKASVTRFLDTFEAGELVHVDFSTQRMPHPKFQGLTGRVLETRGGGYVIQIKDGNKTKTICLKSENLRKASTK
ncbi:MAG: 50S ribosomal protein L21e [Candidatus Aenigmarchaeota archaeon]|nr:50S ribosomal protein L21e [Candidatus Aenigmarchaeota archaeon]